MENPFLDSSFNVAWSQLTPDKIEADISLALEQAQQNIDAIAALPIDQVSYKSVLEALEEATDDLGRAWGYVDHLDSVRNSDALRTVYNAMLPKVTSFYTKISLNENLWKRVRTFAESDEAKTLTGTKQRLLEETLADFTESGADLPENEKATLEKINEELSTITQKYSENVLDSTNAWELIVTDEKRLVGLPESALRGARASAKEKGHEEPAWRFTLHMPSLLPVMQHAEDESLRRELYEASSTIGAVGEHDNTALIWRILELRQQKAKLLSKKHFPELILSRRMAKSSDNALSFIHELHKRVAKPFAEEVAALERFKAEQTGSEPAPLEPWELAYWMEKRRKALFDFDDEQLRPYFPVNKVIEGLFELTQRVFGLRLEERPVAYKNPETGETIQPERKGASGEPREVWDAGVQCYDLFDEQGHLRGSFYADWYPRESKRSGAWMNPLRSSQPGQPQIGVIAGNMSPPIDGKPALLTHDEVETIFHEFGHLLHHLLGEVEVKSLNGTNVPWDFVELPSQIMENWCWEKEALDLFARHYETGEGIPADLLEKVLRARNYGQAFATMRQLAFAKMDLELHLLGDRVDKSDLNALCEKILEGYLPKLARKAPPIVRRFTHLFAGSTGYAAGYYSYKWAEVLDADCFTRFQKEGILNPAVGKDFRQKILSRGNSEPPEKLFQDFMKREPDQNALLIRSGLA